MICGVMSCRGAAGLCFVPLNSTMNGIKYVQLLKEKLKLHVHVHGCTIFTQDGAPCHRLKVATEFREKNEISVLECHGNNPDSSPVKNVWTIMKDKVAYRGAGRSSEVRAFAHGAMGRRIDPSWGGPIELFLVPVSAP